LLRLLLPLNIQVWATSQCKQSCCQLQKHQSEDLTKMFNR